MRTFERRSHLNLQVLNLNNGHSAFRYLRLASVMAVAVDLQGVVECTITKDYSFAFDNCPDRVHTSAGKSQQFELPGGL
eukprot:4202587-Amphidinium_carterae.1